MKTKIMAAALVAMTVSVTASAQRTSVSTDLLGYADSGTLNGEISCSVSRHWSVTTGFRFNPFTFRKGEDNHLVSNRQRTVAAGARYWPWHVYSGWWLSGKAKWQEYNRGGIRSLKTREGDRFGAGVAVGYTYMLASFMNVELSAGAWGGMDVYSVYECPECGVTLESGRKFYVLPHDITLALSFVF